MTIEAIFRLAGLAEETVRKHKFETNYNDYWACKNKQSTVYFFEDSTIFYNYL
jgi:hypothetical protein